jgi:hypothetical protein
MRLFGQLLKDFLNCIGRSISLETSITISIKPSNLLILKLFYVKYSLSWNLGLTCKILILVYKVSIYDFNSLKGVYTLISLISFIHILINLFFNTIKYNRFILKKLFI